MVGMKKCISEIHKCKWTWIYYIKSLDCYIVFMRGEKTKETYQKHKDKYCLKLKGWKKISQANINSKNSNNRNLVWLYLKQAYRQKQPQINQPNNPTPQKNVWRWRGAFYRSKRFSLPDGYFRYVLKIIPSKFITQHITVLSIQEKLTNPPS